MHCTHSVCISRQNLIWWQTGEIQQQKSAVLLAWMVSTRLFRSLVAFDLVKIVSRQQSRFVMDRPYKLQPIKLGCEVTGIKLSEDVPEDVISMIKDDVTKHRLLVFKNQEHLTPEQHLAVGRWFGEIESTFYNHPKSPNRDIFRVSNDRNEGCTNVILFVLKLK